MRVLQREDPGRLDVSERPTGRRGRRCRHAGALALLSICALLGASSLACAAPAAEAEATSRERPAAVAGRFYSDRADQLEASVRAFMARAEPRTGPRPVALLAPHAGYIYSGQIAADAYRQAAGHEYDLIVILGPNHTAPAFDGVSVYDGKGYRTPLGLAELDREVVAELIAADGAYRFRPAVHASEHSVEVQVPFVQVAFPSAKIVTAVVGTSRLELCERFGTKLAEVLEGRRALIVASSDLSHYPNYDDAVTTDLETLEAVTWLDPARLQNVMRQRLRSGVPALSTCACGEAPLLVAMTAARRLGANHARIVSYANSGDTAVGDRSRVVGYGAAVFTARDSKVSHAAAERAPGWRPHASEDDGPLSVEQGQQLLAFARESIRDHFMTGAAPLARGFPPALWRKQGVFVTLKKKGELRGCIGRTVADRPLCQVVGAMALQAAFGDRRFPPLTPDELDQVTIEISMLGPLKLVAGPDAVVIGRDGVVVKKSGRSALFLPEVAVEQGWERDEMFRHLCRKAGLPTDAWREGAEVYTFQTVALHESAP